MVRRSHPRSFGFQRGTKNPEISSEDQKIINYLPNSELCWNRSTCFPFSATLISYWILPSPSNFPSAYTILYVNVEPNTPHRLRLYWVCCDILRSSRMSTLTHNLTQSHLKRLRWWHESIFKLSYWCTLTTGGSNNMVKCVASLVNISSCSHFTALLLMPKTCRAGEMWEEEAVTYFNAFALYSP